ncbi:hypothetical protein RRG08_030639 [Elysia crispata]|uniref:Uncharacterized protein n=1 Tax=Elysia crispata TaxID=231223 RepID=A0AAE0XWT5_9GAST|nr:hypothetical protein RRG08_030639 [Elysia crispata]
MRNATFTAKGDHIAWTQVEQFTMIGSLGPSIVFGYKGILLLIFGIFLAYQTQSVNLKQVLCVITDSSPAIRKKRLLT